MQICKKYRSPAEKTFSRGVFYLRPQGLPLDEAFIREQLLRRMGQGGLTTARQEKEEVHFMEAHFHLT